MRIFWSLAMSTLVMLGISALGFAQQPTPPAPSQAPPPPPPSVKVGDPAPDFTLAYLAPPATEGGRPERKEVRLSDFKGKQNVVLAFFVAAFSPG